MIGSTFKKEMQVNQEPVNTPLKHPPGSIKYLDPVEAVLMTRDGYAVHFDQLFGPKFIEQHHEGWEVIHDLMVEVSILRKVVKESMRREHVLITSSNEFNRGLTSLAHKIGEDPEVLRALVRPYLEELFEQMLAEPKKTQNGRHPRGKRRQRPMREGQ